ncbi:MAG: glycogen/starch/alpha-glucan phosphorylase [Candidatus Methylarchaceae archaeon HK01B]|nr:glycogen/starch/alpha-glucan phosphorylase [Candidatus Methylarchaceae archaeon HK01B]
MIISVTPEIALNEGYTYTGGLGVFEGDKFYGVANLDIPYTALTLFYREAFVDYNFNGEGIPIPKAQPQPPEFLEKLVQEGVLSLNLHGEKIKVEVLKYRKGKAEVIFFNPLEPDWVYHLADHIYMEKSLEEKFHKYTLLAKASAEYIRRFIGTEHVDYIDLQEAYAAFLPLILRIPGKFRLVIHTPGPWGHPAFPNEFFKREFGYNFINKKVVLTDIGLAASREIFTVSAKHFEVMSKVIPHFASKLRYVTNGVDIERWMNPTLKGSYKTGNLDLEHFIESRKAIKKRFAEFIRRYKDIDVEGMIIVNWCKRIVPYKRPDFVIRAIEDIPDKKVLFLLGGRAHPYDGVGLEFSRIFHKLHRERENVVYIPHYTVSEAKELIEASDLLLFTPVSGWEACGTSYMKAAINGVPTLASRDGGAMELIRHGVNGWFFGKDLRELESTKMHEYNIQDYEEFKNLFQEVIRLYRDDTEQYYKVASNALRTSIPRVSIERVLKEYYPDIVKTYM